MISRRQVAAYVADNMTAGRDSAIRDAAAWLVARGRKRQARYLVRDIAQILAARGYVVANVTTARPMSAAAMREIEDYIRARLAAQQIEMTTAVSRDVIGGALIELPGADLDSTVRTKLVKFVEGVSR